MSKRIVGLDIGTYSVKVVHLDPRADLPLVGYEEERVVDAPVDAGAEEGHNGTPFEDQPTGVREAPEVPTEQEEQTSPPPPPAEETLPGEAGWMKAVRALGERGALEGDYLVTCLPEGKAMTIRLDVPFSERAKVASVLPHLLVDRLPMDRGDVVYDFQVFARDDDGEPAGEAIVGFARKHDLREGLDALQSLEVDPVVLGIPELMLATVARHATRDGQGKAEAFIDIGHRHTRVLVLEGDKPLLARTIMNGGHGVTERIARKFKVSYEEAEQHKHQYGAIVDDSSAPNDAMRALSDAVHEGLIPIVREIRRSLQGLYARSRVEVSQIHLCGGTSRIRNIEKYLSNQLGVPARRLSSPRLQELSEEQAARAPLALGLGLSYGIETMRPRTINLRRGPYAYRGKSSFMRAQILKLSAAAGVLLLLLGVGLLLQKQAHEAKRDAMRAAVQKQTRQLFGEPVISKSEIEKRLAGEEAGAKSFLPNMSAYELTYELVSRISKDLDLELDRLEVDVDRNLVQIYGETTDAQAVDRLVSDLEQLECLKEIKKDKLKVTNDQKANFELQISSGCS